MNLKKFFEFKRATYNVELRYLMYGTSATFFLLFGLSLYHFYIGSYAISIVSLLISLVLLYAEIKLEQPKKIKYWKVYLAIFFMVSLFAAIFISGIDSLAWTFPIISAIYFFISSQRFAFLFAVISIVGIFLIISSSISSSELLHFYPAVILYTIFQFCWLSRMSCQRGKLLELVTKDALTKVNNRLSFNTKLAHIIKKRNIKKGELSLLMLDLDHFDKIIDQYGYEKGDIILSTFAKLVKDNIRLTDTVYRCGEEFVVIAENSSLSNSATLAEKLRIMTLNNALLKKYNITVSIGVTTIPLTSDNIENALKMADVAIYKAKEAGRNQVFLVQKTKGQPLLLRV